MIRLAKDRVMRGWLRAEAEEEGRDSFHCLVASSSPGLSPR